MSSISDKDTRAVLNARRYRNNWKRIQAAMNDPAVMMFVGLQARDIFETFLGTTGGQHRLYVSDMMLVEWASLRVNFQRREIIKFLGSVDQCYLPPSEALRTVERTMLRLKNRGYVDSVMVRKYRSYFITNQGKLFLIDLTDQLRKLALAATDMAERPKPLYRVPKDNPEDDY